MYIYNYLIDFVYLRFEIYEGNSCNFVKVVFRKKNYIYDFFVWNVINKIFFFVQGFVILEKDVYRRDLIINR